jgi:hypothetical protein
LHGHENLLVAIAKRFRQNVAPEVNYPPRMACVKWSQTLLYASESTAVRIADRNFWK